MAQIPAIVDRELRFHQRIQLFFCVGFLVAGSAVLYWGFQQTYGDFLVISGGGLILTSIFGALYVRNLWPFHARTVRSQLIQSPERIVWVYHHIVQNRPYGVAVVNFTTLYLHLEDGSEVTARIQLNKADKVLDALKPMLPDATFGYSDEKKFRYEANPLLLRRND